MSLQNNHASLELLVGFCLTNTTKSIINGFLFFKQIGGPSLADVYNFMTYFLYANLISYNTLLSYSFYFASTFSPLVNLFVLPYASS